MQNSEIWAYFPGAELLNNVYRNNIYVVSSVSGLQTALSRMIRARQLESISKQVGGKVEGTKKVICSQMD